MSAKNLKLTFTMCALVFVLVSGTASAESGPAQDEASIASVDNSNSKKLEAVKEDGKIVVCEAGKILAVDLVTGLETCMALQISLSASPNPVTRGGTVSFAWAVSPATDCWDNLGNGTWGNYSFSRVVNDPFTWTVSCTGAGIESRSLGISVQDSPPPPAPTPPSVSLFANPTSVSSGGSSTLSWSSSNANSCGATWTGSTATSGSAVVTPTATTTYTITCSGSGGSASASAQVTVSTTTCPQVAPVNGADPGITKSGTDASSESCIYPTITLSANPANVEYGGVTSVSWSVRDAAFGCTSWSNPASNFGIGPVSGSGSGTVTVGPLYQNTSLHIRCTNYNQAASENYIVVGVGAAPPPPPPGPTAQLSASPTVIKGGESSILSWSSSNASSCSTSWAGTQGPSGSQAVTPRDTTTYSVNCNGATASATVTVNIPPPDPAYYDGSEWTDNPPLQLVYIPKVGCSRVGDGVKYQRPGRTHWTYVSRVSFCWNGGKITQLYAHEVAVDMNQPPFPLSLYQGWVYSSVSYESGSAGSSMTIVRAQGSFEYCAFKYGCLNTRQPWVRIELNRGGQAMCTTSARPAAHACVRL